jgi:proton-dependent oligopeptide transporter, POT family
MTTDAASAPSVDKQPPGLFLLFGVEMWERFSYYGMRAILILFLVDKTMGGWGWPKEDAALLYAWYTSLVYLTPVIGGYLADRVLGLHRAIILGSVLIAAGHFCLALPPRMAFYAGLLLVILGTGFHKSNISTMVGQLYKERDPRRDGGYTIFYMGINLGALVGTAICGYLGESPRFGWHWGFGAAGVGMVAGLFTYVVFKRRYLGSIGDVPTARTAAQASATGTLQPLTREERDRVLAILLLVLFDIFFWLAFEQAGSSMNLYAFEKTDRTILGWTMPASWFQMVNPAIILLFGPVFARLWLRLGERGREPSTSVKFALGLLLLGGGFVFLVFGARTSDAGHKAHMIWLILAYLLHTWGELCISPVGLSMVSKLAPLKYASMMMGLYFGGHFVSHQIAGRLAGVVEKVERGEVFKLLGGQADFFLIFVVTSWVAGVLLLLLAGRITKLTHGRA